MEQPFCAAAAYNPAARIRGGCLAMNRKQESAEHDAAETRGVDQARIEKAVREILLAVGEDPSREGLAKTPSRVARAYAELMAGLTVDPRRHLKTVFHERYDEIVLLRDISFIPSASIICCRSWASARGISAGGQGRRPEQARPARGRLRARPQVQERLTMQIADALMDELNPVGAACVIEASHTCMTIRGVKRPGAIMVTSALRGIFKENAASRAEVLALMHAKDGDSR